MNQTAIISDIPPFSWGTSRRFNAYSDYFKHHFGRRIQKLSIHAGFTCPNRDGTISVGGCTFCNNKAFNPSYCDPSKSITQQINEGIRFHAWRYRRANQYLAYFQPYSNTYSSIDILKQKYEEALSHPQVVGLVIGTRPDCIDDQKLDYLAELSRQSIIIVEYGIESCYDRTLATVHRGHDFAQTRRAIFQTAERGIKTGGHLIFGLPGETIAEMLAQAEILSALPLDTIKFHQLQLFNDTVMADQYHAHPEQFHRFTLDSYVRFITTFLEHLNPRIVIERFAGEVPPRYQAEVGWENIRYEQVVSLIENHLEAQNTYQGKYYTAASCQ